MPFRCLARGSALATIVLTIACGGTRTAFRAEKDVAGYHVGFAADPLIVGERNEATVTLQRNGEPMERALVTLALGMPKMNMPESVVTLRPQGGGRYSGEIRFAMSGYWRVRLAARLLGDANVRTQFDITTRDR